MTYTKHITTLLCILWLLWLAAHPEVWAAVLGIAMVMPVVILLTPRLWRWVHFKLQPNHPTNRGCARTDWDEE